MIVLGRDASASSLYQVMPIALLPSVREISLKEIEVFTYQQVQAVRDHRYGGQRGKTGTKRERHRETDSLHELLVALAAGLAGLGRRNKAEFRPAGPS